VKSRPATATSSILIVIFLLAACRCESDEPLGDRLGTGCASPPGAIFLQSQIDDDDGDGNPYDEAFPLINDEDDDIADHAWIQDDTGLYHLFFQNEGLTSGSHIEHYVSRDLQEISRVGVALEPDPGAWDSYALWAPHIVRSGTTYYMFYAGTSGPGSDPAAEQRIGLATSTDLVTWTRFPTNRCAGTSGDGCIYECAESWTTWNAPSGSYNQQCRDPFVLWDDASHRWLLFATAKSTNGSGVITVATSNDLVTWSGVGFIDATRRFAGGIGAQTTGGQAENPCILRNQGTYYLLFTDWRDPEDSCSVSQPRTIVQFATASALAADSLGSANWTYRGDTPDPGVNATEAQHLPNGAWILSQSISNRDCPDHAEHRRHLRLRQVIWGPGTSFDTQAILSTPRGSPAGRSE
jgi:hypothetical protein